MMVRCDVLELKLKLAEIPEAPVLRYEYWTDLPVGTRVFASCKRYFSDQEDRKKLWTVYSETLLVGEGSRAELNGGEGSFDIDQGDLDALTHYKRTIGRRSGGMKAPPSDELEFWLVVGAKQPLKEFGRGNSNLFGKMVEQEDHLSSIAVIETLESPMNNEFCPKS